MEIKHLHRYLDKYPACYGKLLILKAESYHTSLRMEDQSFRVFIISLYEDIKPGDSYYFKDDEGYDQIFVRLDPKEGVDNTYNNHRERCFKILAETNMLSYETKMKIIKTELKHNQIVLLECENGEIKLTKDCVNVFVQPEVDSWYEVFMKADDYFKTEHPIAKVIGYNHNQLQEYLQQNYLAPKRK